MSTARRVLRNALSLMVSRPLSKLVAFLASVWQVRYLGRSLVGTLDTALGFVDFFAYVSDFGTLHFVIRQVSRDRSTAGTYLNNFLSMQGLFGVFLFAATVLTVNALGYDPPVKQAVYLAGGGLMVISMAAPFKAVFHAHEAIHISAIVEVVLVLAEAALTVGGILLGAGVRFFAAISIFSGLTVVAVSYFVCKERFVLPRFGSDIELWWRMLKMSFPFALLLGASIIYKKIDIQMLYAMKGEVAVGYYAAVVRLVYPLLMPAQVIMTAVYPVLSRRHAGSQEKFRFGAEKTLKYIAALAIPMAVGVFLLSDRIILLLYREPFRASIPALRILSWTLPLSSVNIAITISVVASGRVLIPAAFNAIGALANVGLNLLLIPLYSFQGAAVATVACEVVLLTTFVLYMLRCEVAAFPWAETGKAIFAALIMGGFVLVFRSASIFIVIPAAAVIYFGILLLVGFVGKEERELLKSALSRK